MASQLDTGVERRYLSLDWHDDVTLDTVTGAVGEIRGIAEEQRVGDLVGDHWAKVESLDEDDEGDYRLELVSP